MARNIRSESVANRQIAETAANRPTLPNANRDTAPRIKTGRPANFPTPRNWSLTLGMVAKVAGALVIVAAAVSFFI